MSKKGILIALLVGAVAGWFLVNFSPKDQGPEIIWGKTWWDLFKLGIGPALIAFWAFTAMLPDGGQKSSGKIRPKKIRNKASDRKKFEKDTPRTFLQTDRGKFLDSRKFLYQLVHTVSTSPKKESVKGENDAVQAQVKELLFAELADKRGVQIEAVLTALGGIAGFSVQMMIREAYVDSGKVAEDKIFVVIGGADGEKYFSGDNINEGVMAPRPGNLSVWSLVAGAPHSVGAPLPDIADMVSVMAKSYGSPAFWVPDVPQENMPRLMPKELLNRYWNVVRNIQMMNVGVISTMPFSIAQLAQLIILENKAIIDPTIGAKVVMEAALRMSRIDPKHVQFARFEQPV
ncbi:MAG: hypothetical protein Q7T44_07455 [Parvibaculum sp.]|nr:hypothetical protein [Parvibaculum sp.]